MPGATQQVQYWFVPLLPLIFSMTGIPILLTFWVTNAYYPLVFYTEEKEHHYILLACAAYLLTIGPQRQFFKPEHLFAKMKKD